MSLEDEDQYPPKPRWIGWAIVVVMVLVGLGVFNIGWLILRPDPVNAAVAAAATDPVLREGRKLVEGSDCLRCHGIERKAVGPSFQEVAARYATQAQAEAYLAGKVRNGSVGEWGKVIMPRHPQISEAQSLQMARWVLSTAPAAEPAPR